MKSITKKLLFGYIFVMLVGSGCLGFVFLNFLTGTNAIVTATCVTTILLLAAYIAVAFVYSRKRLSQGTENKKHPLSLLIALAGVTIALAVLFFMFHGSISTFFIENPALLRSIITILFVTAMVAFVLLWFGSRKNTMQNK